MDKTARRKTTVGGHRESISVREYLVRAVRKYTLNINDKMHICAPPQGLLCCDCWVSCPPQDCCLLKARLRERIKSCALVFNKKEGHNAKCSVSFTSQANTK